MESTLLVSPLVGQANGPHCRGLISYNDCCGKQSCAQCACTRNDSEEPAYRPFNNNDVNWCLAAKSHIYHCTVSVIRGVAI
jgi:methylamine dehydrogenase light chain